MSRTQKIGRTFLLTGTLVVVCILTAMLGAAGIFIFQQGRDMASNFRDLLRDLGIIFVSMLINTGCVFVLLQIKKADHKLIKPTDDAAKPGAEAK